MDSFDIILIVLLALFMLAGWRKGLLKKLIALVCLGIALILATKYASSVGEELLGFLGLSAGGSTTAAFILIVCSIMFAQAVIYKVAIKKLGDGVWNRVGGLVFGLVEGGIIISMLLIFLGIYVHYPSAETRYSSMLYKPVKNFAPRVFDNINTFFPESEDFYEGIVNWGKKAADHKEQLLHQ